MRRGSADAKRHDASAPDAGRSTDTVTNRPRAAVGGVVEHGGRAGDPSKSFNPWPAQTRFDPFAATRRTNVASTETQLAGLGFSNLELLAHGGFSSVYRATDTKLDREVAIKVTEHLERGVAYSILREAQTAARIEHPNVLPIYHAGVLDRDVVFMVLPLAQGDLDHIGPMQRPEVLDLGVKLSSALATLHASGLVHGDVKPSNILFLNGRPVLADFGLTAPIGDASVQGLTPLYAAPEVVTEGVRSPASDVYSLALTLVFLLSEKARVTTLQDRNAGPIEVRQEIRQAFPDEYVERFMRALAPRPSDRPSARDFGLLLQEMQGSLGYAMTPLELSSIRKPLSRVAFNSPFSGDVDLMVLSLGAGNQTFMKVAEQVEARRSRRDALRVLQTLGLGAFASALGAAANLVASEGSADLAEYGLALAVLIIAAGIVSIGSLTFRAIRVRRRTTLASRALAVSGRIRNAYALELDAIRASVTNGAPQGRKELTR